VSSQAHINVAASSPSSEVLYTGAPVGWSTDFELVIRARKAAGVEAADAVDAIWTDSYARVMADQSFGGLAQYVAPGVMTVATDEGETSLAQLTWRFTVLHQTNSNVIT
jgi:hypothetical protein